MQPWLSTETIINSSPPMIVSHQVHVCSRTGKHEPCQWILYHR
jgi:hypothetical protein